jgi:predicted  nucleic acid-binding Zn-ribbon protein
MKKRRSANSSLELFLDTICNVFGGILFIAILIAIQIQQTEGIIKPIESSSPEKIAEMRRELDQVSTDIAASKVLFDALRSTMPKPKDPAEQELTDQFYELSSAKGSAAVKKAELLDQLLAKEKEMLDWKDKINDIETMLRQKEMERQKIEKEAEQQQNNHQKTKTLLATLQSEIDELNRQIAQKEKNLNDHTSRQRNEIVYLPKLRDAGNKKPEYFVLRFNRFYKVRNRSDFDYTGNYLGIPKRNRGIPVENTEESKRQIQSLFQSNVSNREFLSVFVYGDSADQWYIVRDLIVTARFEYELTPTADDTPWTFGGNGDSPSVQ